MFAQITVIGLGLIGGSLFRRLHHAGIRTVGYDRDPATREAADAADVGEVSPSIEAAVDGSDLVVMATPILTAPSVLKDLSCVDYRGLVTDVTSVKAPIEALVQHHLPHARWVGGHPMAGTHQSGFAASNATLFDDCAWVLCLEDDDQLNDWLALAHVITEMGSRVVPTTATAHDEAVARISHAPHILAAALTTTAAEPDAGRLALTLGAGSFRDGTRVAAGPTNLSAAMCGGNASALDAQLAAIIQRLEQARTLLSQESPIDELRDWFEPAHRIRSSWPPQYDVTETFTPSRRSLLELGNVGGWVTAVHPAPNTVTTVRPMVATNTAH